LRSLRAFSSPLSARLQNIEAFARRLVDVDKPDLTLNVPASYFSVHPVVCPPFSFSSLP
jgi:hypothetical protein